MASVEVIERLDRLEALRAEWDALAVAARRPFCAPAWTLATARHLAPRGARLLAVAVRDGDALVGIAPFWLTSRWAMRELRPLGGGLAHRAGPLAAPQREDEVARLIAPVLAEAVGGAGAVRIEGADRGERWAERLAAAWPGRGARVAREHVLPAPTLTAGPRSHDEWLASKSSNFRQWSRRLRRRAAARGAVVSLATGGERLTTALEAFTRLHEARWAARGGSALPAATRRILDEAGAALAGDGRFRVWTVAIDGTVVSAQIFVAAGGEVAYWNGGFDERWASLSPAALAMLAAVEDAFARGEHRIDLGGGADPYKLRLADRDDPVVWETVLPAGARYPLARLAMAPRQARRGARRAAHRTLGQARIQRLKTLRRRFAAGAGPRRR